MQINRSNYEIWLIDWLDGNLSDLQVDQLKFFLSENPDIREEFDEFTSLKLKPLTGSSISKDHLKKSVGDLYMSQFEYLCTAYLENDLRAAQKTELKESLIPDPEKEKIFNLIQAMKLDSPEITYKHKNQLFRITRRQRIINLSLVVSGAAALIALVLITNLNIRGKLSDKIINVTQNILADTGLIQPPPEKGGDMFIPDKKEELNIEKASFQSDRILKKDALEMKVVSLPDELSLRKKNYSEPGPQKIPVHPDIPLNRVIIGNVLVPPVPYLITPSPVDEGSNLSRFIAKTFRRNMLREKAPGYGPLKVYEIAEAGISGLNKLLGWQMSLVENKDNAGELKSIYFNSKILKFNAPVKKSVSRL